LTVEKCALPQLAHILRHMLEMERIDIEKVEIVFRVIDDDTRLRVARALMINVPDTSLFSSRGISRSDIFTLRPFTYAGVKFRVASLDR
jgi:hypothetical protein